jgi:hypothetical protein
MISAKSLLMEHLGNDSSDEGPVVSSSKDVWELCRLFVQMDAKVLHVVDEETGLSQGQLRREDLFGWMYAHAGIKEGAPQLFCVETRDRAQCHADLALLASIERVQLRVVYFIDPPQSTSESRHGCFVVVGETDQAWEPFFSGLRQKGHYPVSSTDPSEDELDLNLDHLLHYLGS